MSKFSAPSQFYWISLLCSKSLNRILGWSFFFKLEFTPCKAEEPLPGMELQEKETQTQKD